MYLLILEARAAMENIDLNLHSIMYLLIHGKGPFAFLEVKFTFHNVSINSLLVATASAKTSLFTFHNVSINSKTLYDNIDLSP